jgi:hypothetical protein
LSHATEILLAEAIRLDREARRVAEELVAIRRQLVEVETSMRALDAVDVSTEVVDGMVHVTVKGQVVPA